MKKLLLSTLCLALGLGAFAQVIVGTSPTDKNVILEELTGKTCVYCPDGHKRAQQLKDANPGRVVLLNIHAGGYAAGIPNYRTPWGNYMDDLFSVSGYPTGAINRTDFGNGVMHSRVDWVSNANTVLAESSPVNVGGMATIDLETRELTLDVEAYYTADGPGSSNKINVVIMQNNIAGPQTGGSTFYPEQILPDGQYNHRHMVRHTLTPNTGDDIANISATSLYTNTYTYTIPTDINDIPVNLVDLEIAVYVSEENSTGKIVSGDYATIDFTTATVLAASNTDAELDVPLGSVCGTSVDANMKVTNMGNTPLTTATFEYVVNGGTPDTYQHTFSTPLQTAHYENVTISIPGLTPGGASNTIDISITMLNGGANPGSNVSNGHDVLTASVESDSTTEASFTITTDNYGSETEWELFDETTGSTVMSGGPYPNVTGGQTYGPFTATLENGNCYKFQITDAYGDGICCDYGNGSYSLTVGATTLSEGGDFTTIGGDNFVFDYTLSTNQYIVENSLSIFPNPVSSSATINFDLVNQVDAIINVTNIVGQKVYSKDLGRLMSGAHTEQIDMSSLGNGLYLVQIRLNDEVVTKKITVAN